MFVTKILDDLSNTTIGPTQLHPNLNLRNPKSITELEFGVLF